jgi:hypothetical protein
MPLPTRFANNIAIPMVNTNPNVTQRKPSNVRHAVVCVKGAVSHGNRPTDSRVRVMDPATPMWTYATTTSPCRRALRRRRSRRCWTTSPVSAHTAWSLRQGLGGRGGFGRRAARRWQPQSAARERWGSLILVRQAWSRCPSTVQHGLRSSSRAWTRYSLIPRTTAPTQRAARSISSRHSKEGV